MPLDLQAPRSKRDAANESSHTGQNERIADLCRPEVDHARRELPQRHRFLEAIALHGGHLGGTTARPPHLLDQYGAAAVESAIQEAHQRGAFAAQSVAHILDQHRGARGTPVPLDRVLPDDPRVRDLVIVPHRLDSYDRLVVTQAEAQP